jgi:hypothetical protein
MEILLARGLDNIRFGQTEDDVICQLGEPDKTYLLDYSKCIQFFELRVVFSFEFEQDNRLGWIEVHHPEAILFGLKLIGQNREKVLSVISSQIVDEPEVDDYGSFESYLYGKYELELQFEFNCLRSINFGFLWLDNDTPDWP